MTKGPGRLYLSQTRLLANSPTVAASRRTRIYYWSGAASYLTTAAWLKGELGTRLSFVTYRDAQFWNYPPQGLLDHEDRMINS
jgi:hypothetical protein